MDISRAVTEDLSELRSLLATRGWNETFDADLGVIYIARDPSVVGCLQVIDVGLDTAVLDHVIIDEPRRRHGIGTALLRAAMADHSQKLYLSCREDAVPFYETLGFSLLADGLDEAPQVVKELWRRTGNRAPLAMLNDRR